MLLARYAPVGSLRYKKLAQSVKTFDTIMKWFPAQLFGIWTVFVTGISAGKTTVDRYYFWDWSDWWIGLIGITAIILLVGILGLKQKRIQMTDISASSKSIAFHLILSFILFNIGSISYNTIYTVNAILYIMAYLAIYLVHAIKCEKTEGIIISQNDKNTKTGIAIILLFVIAIIGYVLNDPVISTGSVVALPFMIVLLFGKHFRHLERAKFYPIFIFAMFVASREAWFLIPLILLFFILRSYNYLRYQKAYPTFGVSDDRS